MQNFFLRVHWLTKANARWRRGRREGQVEGLHVKRKETNKSGGGDFRNRKFWVNVLFKCFLNVESQSSTQLQVQKLLNILGMTEWRRGQNSDSKSIYWINVAFLIGIAFVKISHYPNCHNFYKIKLETLAKGHNFCYIRLLTRE